MINKESYGLVFGVLLFGGIWGFTEATLGYVLNLSTIGISGCIMFPIGFYILQKAYKKTGKLSIVFYAGLVAGSIKLVNLLMPISHPVKVINPAIAIVLETLSVVILFAWVVKGEKKISLVLALLTAFSWRFIYFLDAVGLYYLGIPSRMIEKGPQSYLGEFLLMNTLINGILIFAIARLEERYGKNIKTITNFKPLTAFLSLFLAVGAQLFFSWLR